MLAIREEMAREADHDAIIYSEMIRTGRWTEMDSGHRINEPAERRAAESVIEPVEKITEKRS